MNTAFYVYRIYKKTYKEQGAIYSTEIVDCYRCL